MASHLTEVEAQIAGLIAARESLASANNRLRTVKRIGPVVAAVLLARLREPGRSDHRQLASRARHIAAKSASQCDQAFKAFRKRRTAAGKPVKSAIIPRAGKLLTVLAAMSRNGEDFRKQPT